MKMMNYPVKKLKAKSYRKLIAKTDDFEYYVIYENEESHMEVNLIQPSGNERSYWERMSCWGFQEKVYE